MTELWIPFSNGHLQPVLRPLVTQSSQYKTVSSSIEKYRETAKDQDRACAAEEAAKLAGLLEKPRDVIYELFLSACVFPGDIEWLCI